MPLLNTADALYVGANLVASAYKGATEVWSGGGGGVTARFGNETLPAGDDTDLNGESGRIFLTKFTVPSSGTLDFISVYSPVGGTGIVKGVMYSDSLGAPDALIAVGAPVNTNSIGYHISTCSGEALIGGSDVWLGAIHFDFNSVMRCNASTGDGWAQFGDSNYASPENPLVSGFATGYNIAVFAEYTT